MGYKYVYNFSTDNLDMVQDLSGYVPYVGATQDVDLGIHTLTSSQHFVNFTNDDYNNVGGANSHILMNNVGGAQNVISSMVDNVMKAKWRTDNEGNVNWVSYGNDPVQNGHYFFVNGDYGDGGTIAMMIDGNTNIHAVGILDFTKTGANSDTTTYKMYVGNGLDQPYWVGDGNPGFMFDAYNTDYGTAMRGGLYYTANGYTDGGLMEFGLNMPQFRDKETESYGMVSEITGGLFRFDNRPGYGQYFAVLNRPENSETEGYPIMVMLNSGNTIIGQSYFQEATENGYKLQLVAQKAEVLSLENPSGGGVMFSMQPVGYPLYQFYATDDGNSEGAGKMLMNRGSNGAIAFCNGGLGWLGGWLETGAYTIGSYTDDGSGAILQTHGLVHLNTDGLSLDVEKITNGVFDGTTGWSTTTGWDASSFVFTCTAPATLPSVGATYTNNGSTFTFRYANTAKTLLVFSRTSGANNPTATGTLVRTSGTGTTPITFSTWGNSAAHYTNGTGSLTQYYGDMVSIMVAGETYSFTYTISNLTVGSVQPVIGGVTLTSRSADGTYTEVFRVLETSTNIVFNPSNTARFLIDDVSLKRATDGDLNVDGVITTDARIVAKGINSIFGGTEADFADDYIGASINVFASNPATINTYSASTDNYFRLSTSAGEGYIGVRNGQFFLQSDNTNGPVRIENYGGGLGALDALISRVGEIDSGFYIQSAYDGSGTAQTIITNGGYAVSSYEPYGDSARAFIFGYYPIEFTGRDYDEAYMGYNSGVSINVVNNPGGQIVHTANESIFTGKIFLGNSITDGSWRINQLGTDLLFERRESGNWVTKFQMTA